MNKEQMIREGELFRKLIEANCDTVYRFCCKTFYSTSRVYKLINGECSLLSLSVDNARKFVEALNLKSIDELYNACGIVLY